MEKQLINYISDTTNPEFNYELGLVYKNLGHTSSAVSYLLRAAERSEDLNLSYECLLLIADCFIQQKNRDFTVKGLYLHAITVLPKRPEAYYLLSKLYETRSEYSECYTISEIGLNISDFDLPPLRTYFGHTGKYGLMFQKAFASWWWGKGTESRKLFRELAFKHWDELDENLKGAVENNLMRLENKKFTYPKDFEWADLTEEDIVTIDREIVNENVYRFWEDGGINGRFQTCTAGTPLVYHYDAQQWAGMVYLTPDAPPQCGTSFFRHKETKIRHNYEINWESGDGNRVFNQHTFLDGTPYELVDKIGNVFNRLVIFDGGLIHSASEYFGWDILSSRLFHMFFFNTVGLSGK